ncbi:TPA: DUF4034 domain-containing protein [Serratia liquefaciens]|nr:DUF4034 domain-containing protein [Serratia liquefaciens]
MKNLHCYYLEIRPLVEARDFQSLTRYYDEVETSWWTSRPETHLYHDLLTIGTMFDHSQDLDYKLITRFLLDWVEACPDAYHPKLILGIYCFYRACNIRSSDTAENVSDAQWLGASLVCEIASQALLQALELHKRPIFAGSNLMLIALHFGESDWLARLFANQPPVSLLEQYSIDHPVLEEALAYLHNFGLDPLGNDIANARIPSALPARQPHEHNHPGDYWLHQVLTWYPDNIQALSSYAHYLMPRWGGTPGDIDAFASGHLCSGLSEAQRNSIRWIGEWDQLEIFPEPEDTTDAEAYDIRFESWLHRDLLIWDRITILSLYANFCHYTLQDEDKALRLHIESVHTLPDTWHDYFSVRAEGPFRDFAHLMIFGNRPDTSGAFKLAVERFAAQVNTHPTPLALAAIGHKFGRWGFEVDLPRAEKLLDHVGSMRRMEYYDRDGFAPTALAKMLWEAGEYEQGYFLAHELAVRRLPFACDLLNNLLHKTANTGQPAQYIQDKATIDSWLFLAVEENSHFAKFNLAWQRYREEEVDHSDRKNLEKTLSLLTGKVLEEPETAYRAYLLMGSLLREYGNKDEKIRARWEILPPLTDVDDNWIAGRTCAEIAIAYQYGEGVAKNLLAAREWVTHAMLLLPDDSFVQEAQQGVERARSLFSKLASMLGFSARHKVAAKDLPPTRTFQ